MQRNSIREYMRSDNFSLRLYKKILHKAKSLRYEIPCGTKGIVDGLKRE